MKKKYILTSFIIILLLFVIRRFDSQSLAESLVQISLWSVILLIGIQILSQLLLNLQWHRLAASGGARLGFRDMFYINSQAEIVHGLPGGHIGCEITRFAQISRMGNCSKTQAAAVVAAQKLFSLSTFFFINLFAAGFLIGKVPLLQDRYLQFTLYAILLAFLLMFASLFLIPRQMLTFLERKNQPRFSWICKIRKFIITLLEQIILIRQSSKIWVSFLLLAALIWLIYPIKMYLLAVQFMPNADILYISATVFVSYMVALIPIFPGGLGGFEATMTGLLLFTGFTPSDALVITVVFRFITFWFVLLFSAMFISFYKLKYPRLKLNPQGNL